MKAIDQVARDVDDIEDFLEAAEMIGGTLALDVEGRLVVYGVEDVQETIRKMNTTGSTCPVMLRDIGLEDGVGFEV